MTCVLPISLFVNNCGDINDHTLKLIGVWLVGYWMEMDVTCHRGHLMHIISVILHWLLGLDYLFQKQTLRWQRKEK